MANFIVVLLKKLPQLLQPSAATNLTLEHSFKGLGVKDLAPPLLSGWSSAQPTDRVGTWAEAGVWVGETLGISPGSGCRGRSFALRQP